MWLAVTLVIDAEAGERLTDELLDAGAISVDTSDAEAGTPQEKPLFGEPSEPGGSHWNHVKLTALFTGDDPVDASVRRALAEAGLDANTPYATAAVAEQDWVRATQDQFGPLQVSRRIWVVPSWSEPPCPSGLNLMIDPGLAFGTGSHPTTRLCLAWLDANVQGGECVLDYGCGSGILAIAAMKLGAARACGVDIDPAALVAARDNAMQNQVVAEFVTADCRLEGAFDIVMANILANPLHLLAPVLARATRQGGRVALSGVLENQAEDLRAVYGEWFEMDTLDRAEGWVLLGGLRR